MRPAETRGERAVDHLMVIGSVLSLLLLTILLALLLGAYYGVIA